MRSGQLRCRGRCRRRLSARRRPCACSRAAPRASPPFRRWRGSGNGRARPRGDGRGRPGSGAGPSPSAFKKGDKRRPRLLGGPRPRLAGPRRASGYGRARAARLRAPSARKPCKSMICALQPDRGRYGWRRARGTRRSRQRRVQIPRLLAAYCCPPGAMRTEPPTPNRATSSLSPSAAVVSRLDPAVSSTSRRRAASPFLISASPRHAGTTAPRAAADRGRRSAPARNARRWETSRPGSVPPPGSARQRPCPAPSEISAPKATISPKTTSNANTGERAKVKVTTRNSLMNTPVAGNPAIANPPITQRPAERGLAYRQAADVGDAVARPSALRRSGRR